MDEATALKLRKKLIFSAKKYRQVQDAEDLAHDVLVKWLENKGCHQIANHAMIDAIRSRFGDSRGHGFKDRQRLERAGPLGGLKNSLTHSMRSAEAELIHYDLFYKLIEPLNPTERAAIICRVIWDFSNLELSEMFGITGSGISLRNTAIRKKLLERLKQLK